MKLVKVKKCVKSIRRSSLIRKLENTVIHNKKLISLGDTNESFFRSGWETCDLINADYTVNFQNKLLPFEDESVDAFYSSHVIEHIEYKSCSNLIREIYRCLKPGGYFRVVTPDMDLLLNNYSANDWRFFLQADGEFILSQVSKGKLPAESLLIQNRLVGWFASYSGRLDTAGGPIVDKSIVDNKLSRLSKYEFRDWCVSLLEKGRIYAHIHIYDNIELSTLLKEVGFQDIHLLSYGNSSCSDMTHPTIDVEEHQTYSLYIECKK